MRCISAYLWELREVHKKIQNEPRSKEEQEEIAVKITEEA